MAWRGAQTEGTFEGTARKLYSASPKDKPVLAKKPRLIWLMRTSEVGHSALWKDDQVWLSVVEDSGLAKDGIDEATDRADTPLKLSAALHGDLKAWGSPGVSKDKPNGKRLVLRLRKEATPQGFEVRAHRSLLALVRGLFANG